MEEKKLGTCQGETLGYADECEAQATHTIKVEDGERYGVCDECYDTASEYRYAAWAAYYHSR